MEGIEGGGGEGVSNKGRGSDRGVENRAGGRAGDNAAGGEVHRLFRPGGETEAGAGAVGNEVKPVKTHQLAEFVPVTQPGGEVVWTEPGLAREEAVSDLGPGEILVGPRVPNRSRSLRMKQ